MSDLIVDYLENQLALYLEDLRTLVSIDSGTRHKAGVDTVTVWLAGRLTHLGFQLKWDRQTNVGDNLLATFKGKGRGKILLLGHSDTVFPVGTAAKRPMSTEGDKILGPGTCDMKAGLISGIYALEALQAVGFKDFETIQFLCISDEESHPVTLSP